MGIFNKANSAQRKMEKAFERALGKAPVEEQLAACAITKNLMNGCSWAFCGEEIKEYESDFAKSRTCRMQQVTYDRETGTMGCLVSMQLGRILELLGPDNGGPLTAKDVEIIEKGREEAGIALIDRLKSGYAGIIAIYHTGSSGSVTINGMTFPAFVLPLQDVCYICSRIGYGIVVGGIPRDPSQVMRREDALIKALMLTPSCDGLLIKVAPMNLYTPNAEQPEKMPAADTQSPENIPDRTVQEGQNGSGRLDKEGYWKEFVEYAFYTSPNHAFREAGFPIAPAADRNWYALRVGSAKVHIELSFNTQKKTIRTAMLIKDRDLLEKLRKVLVKRGYGDRIVVNTESKTMSISNISDDIRGSRIDQYLTFMVWAVVFKSAIDEVLG